VKYGVEDFVKALGRGKNLDFLNAWLHSEFVRNHLEPGRRDVGKHSGSWSGTVIAKHGCFYLFIYFFPFFSRRFVGKENTQYSSMLPMAAVLLLNLNPENALGQKNLHICDVLCRTAFATQLLRAAVVTPASVEAVEGALRRLKVARDGLTDFVYTVKLRKHLISLLNVLDTAKAKEVHEKKKQNHVTVSLWTTGTKKFP
jgi:hypothetical protein